MISFYPWQKTFLSIEEAQKGGGIQPTSSDITIPKSSQFEAWTSHITYISLDQSYKSTYTINNLKGKKQQKNPSKVN